jgi:hypothetical protein
MRKNVFEVSKIDLKTIIRSVLDFVILSKSLPELFDSLLALPFVLHKRKQVFMCLSSDYTFGCLRLYLHALKKTETKLC